MPFVSFGPRDPVFEAFGFAWGVQLTTLANVHGIDLEQTSARLEERAFVVRAAGLAHDGQTKRAPGAVVLRIEPEAGGGLRVRLRAKAPDPIRSLKLVLRGLATPLEIVEEGLAHNLGATGEILAHPHSLRLPHVTLRCAGELLVARCEDRRARAKRFGVWIEREGARAGQGVLEIIHEEGACDLDRECEAPPCVIARGDEARGMQAAQLAFARRISRLRK